MGNRRARGLARRGGGRVGGIGGGVGVSGLIELLGEVGGFNGGLVNGVGKLEDEGGGLGAEGFQASMEGREVGSGSCDADEGEALLRRRFGSLLDAFVEVDDSWGGAAGGVEKLDGGVRDGRVAGLEKCGAERSTEECTLGVDRVEVDRHVG